MSKLFSKKTVELSAAKPSRIRRDPVSAAPAKKAVNAYPTEREVWTVVIGVILFALAIAVITVGVSDYTAH
jgi:hypothetical protein